jgi:hypothetical protein
MKKVAVVLFVVAAVVLFQGLTGPSATFVDRFLADASLAMGIPLLFVAVAFWAADE